MSARVWKYRLNDPGQKTELELPIYAVPLMVDHVGVHIFLWASVDPESKSVAKRDGAIKTKSKEIRTFIVVGTGDKIRKHWAHIGSFVVRTYREVYHVFEVT